MRGRPPPAMRVATVILFLAVLPLVTQGFLESLFCPCSAATSCSSTMPLCQRHCGGSCGGGGGGLPSSYPSYNSAYAQAPMGIAHNAFLPPPAPQPIYQIPQQPTLNLMPVYRYGNAIQQLPSNQYPTPRLSLQPPQSPPDLQQSQPPAPTYGQRIPPSPPFAVAPQQAQPLPPDDPFGPLPGAEGGPDLTSETTQARPMHTKHPTLVELEPAPFGNGISHHQDTAIEYSHPKTRGEGRSDGYVPPPPLSAPERADTFENFDRDARNNEITPEKPPEREEDFYDEPNNSKEEEPRAMSPNDIQEGSAIPFNTPREARAETSKVGPEPDGSEGDRQEQEQEPNEQVAAEDSSMKRSYRWIKWAMQGKRTKKENEQDKNGPVGHPPHKCNNALLKSILEEKMVGSPSASKQMVYAAVRNAFGRSPDVICSRSSFSYIVVSSPIYCEHRKPPSTCFVYFQP